MLGPSKRFWVMGAALVALALFFSSYVTFGVSVTDLQLATARKGGFSIEVNSVGTLDAARSYTVSSEIKGNKGKIIHVAEDGEWVEQGDTLVRFDPSPFEEEALSLSGKVRVNKAVLDAARQSLEWEKSHVDREIRVAELNLMTAKLELSKLINGDGPLQLAQLKGDMEEMRQKHTKHENFVGDLKKLEEKGFSNPTEISLAIEKAAQLKEMFAVAKKKYTSYSVYILPSQIESAKMSVKQAEIENAQTNKGGAFKIAKAAAGVEKARQDLFTAQEQLAKAQLELGKTTITAPFKGIVVLHETYRNNVKRKPRVGDTVWQNQPILYLPDISSFIVKTKIREVDLHKIQSGQKARIRVDAYPDVAFTGRVTSVGALAKSASGNSKDLGKEKYFQLTISVDGSDTRLRPGMTARARVLSEKVEGALIVPLHALFSDGGRKYCYLSVGRRFEKTYVKVGRQNEDFAEILAGLNEGDALSLAEPGLLPF